MSEFITVPKQLDKNAIRKLAEKHFEESQKNCPNKFGQFNETNKERWIQNYMGKIKNLHTDFIRTFESL